MKHPILFIAAIAALTACDSGVETRKDAAPAVESPLPALLAAPTVAPLVADGPAVTVQPAVDTNIQWAASVLRLDLLTKQGGPTVKLFGTAGGDPAMNGLYTDIAFFKSSAEGWVVFRVGDFLDYTVLSEAPGRVDLKIEESVLDAATGRIGRRERRLIIRWTPGADEAPPAAITVTPAR